MKNTKTDRHEYAKLTLLQQEQYKSAVKRLNERMRDLERKGYTGSNAYKNLSSWVASMPNKVDKTGHLRAVQTYKLTPKQMERTMAISNNKEATAGFEKQKAIKHLKSQGVDTPTTEQVKNTVNLYGQLHDFIVHNTDAYYGNPELGLEDAVHRPWNEKLTESEVEKFFELMKTQQQVKQDNIKRYDQWLVNKYGDETGINPKPHKRR